MPKRRWWSRSTVDDGGSRFVLRRSWVELGLFPVCFALLSLGNPRWRWPILVATVGVIAVEVLWQATVRTEVDAHEIRVRSRYRTRHTSWTDVRLVDPNAAVTGALVIRTAGGGKVVLAGDRNDPVWLAMRTYVLAQAQERGVDIKPDRSPRTLRRMQHRAPG